MKKMVLGVSRALVVLVFAVSPAMSAATDPAQGARVLSAADQAFLATLAPPAPVPVAKRPTVRGKALCTASANCGSGGTISCEGNNSTTSCSSTDQSCPTVRGSVTCDGVTTVCPNSCCPDLDCAAERADCESTCSPCLFNFSCSTSTCTLTCHCRFSSCS